MSPYQILRNCVILSILIHFLFGFSASYFYPYVPPTQLSLVELVENAPKKQTPKTKDTQSFVRQATPPEPLKIKEKKPAHFFSQEDQSVMQEMKAAQSGMTENRSNSASNKMAKAQDEEKIEGKKPKKVSKISESELTKIRPEENKLMGDIDIKRNEKTSPPQDDSKPMIFPQVGGFGPQRGSSTLGETLPQDIRIGEFTALNTDRFTYYTFFARMEEVFRPRWINYVKAAVYTYQQTQRRTREEEFVTQVELLLDKNGNFVRGILHKGSGNEALDLAPVRAFRDAIKFPNPPQEMIKDDSYIHLDYQFTVHFVPQYLGTSSE